MFTCCGQEAVWVDNVPGKEYWYCRECKNEVIPVIPVAEGFDDLVLSDKQPAPIVIKGLSELYKHYQQRVKIEEDSLKQILS